MPLADGAGDVHVSCLHLEPGGAVTAPSIDHAATLLVVHGRMNITRRGGAAVNLTVRAGMGCIVAAHEPYSFRTDAGAIIVIVESTTLNPNSRGICRAQRVAGATWPSDALLVPTDASAPARRPSSAEESIRARCPTCRAAPETPETLG